MPWGIIHEDQLTISEVIQSLALQALSQQPQSAKRIIQISAMGAELPEVSGGTFATKRRADQFRCS